MGHESSHSLDKSKGEESMVYRLTPCSNLILFTQYYFLGMVKMIAYSFFNPREEASYLNFLTFSLEVIVSPKTRESRKLKQRKYLNYLKNKLCNAHK